MIPENPKTLEAYNLLTKLIALRAELISELRIIDETLETLSTNRPVDEVNEILTRVLEICK